MAQPDFDPETGEIREPSDGDGGGPGKTLFASFIQSQREGLLHSELTEGLADCVQAVIDLNKKGSITLKISIEPSGKDQKTIFIKDTVKIDAPEDRPKSLFFSDGHGNVSRRDPNQMSIGDHLKEVPGKPDLKELPKE